MVASVPSDDHINHNTLGYNFPCTERLSTLESVLYTHLHYIRGPQSLCVCAHLAHKCFFHSVLKTVCAPIRPEWSLAV